MKLSLLKVVTLFLLSGISLPAFSQVDIRVYQAGQGGYVSLDTLTLTIDPNDNTGIGATKKLVYFNIYNLSHTQPEAFYMEAEWLCSNSSAFYQFCQEYPSDYSTGTCHTFHRDGVRVYDDYNYTIPPDTCSYNYLRCHFFIYDYSVEQQHEKICRFYIKRRNTHELLDSMYLIIRRGNLPCSGGGPTAINAATAEDAVSIYPNPARNSFTIAAMQDQWAGYSLYSPDGKRIVDQKIESVKNVNIPVGNLSNGVYYLRLTDKKGQSLYKKVTVDH